MRRAATTSLLATILLTGGVAAAQDNADPLAVPGETSAEASASVGVTADGSVSASGGGEVSAGGARGLGVGALLMLAEHFSGQLIGPAVYYDLGRFHIEGLLAFGSGGATDVLGLGGRFWFHVHESARADFSVGGGIGLFTVNNEGEGGDSTQFDLEGGGLLRWFLVDNVAVSFAVGLAVYAGDSEGVDLVGDLTGTGGVSYYF